MARYDFEFVSELYDIVTIGKGNGVEQQAYLNRTFGRARWRKLKGKAIIRYHDGRVVEAEIHWFEAHGIGRVNDCQWLNLLRIGPPDQKKAIDKVTENH